MLSKSPQRVGILVLMVAAVCSAQQGALPADPSKEIVKVVDAEVYRSVLDQVFPLSYKRSPSVSYVIVVRRMPSHGSESQMVVVVRDRGPVEIVDYSPASGNIFSYLNKTLSTNQSASTSELASQIRVNVTRRYIARDEAAQWERTFLSASGKMLEKFEKEANLAIATQSHEVILDGDSYDVRFILGDRQLVWHYTDAETDCTDSGANPMTCWIKSIQRRVNAAIKEG